MIRRCAFGSRIGTANTVAVAVLGELEHVGLGVAGEQRTWPERPERRARVRGPVTAVERVAQLVLVQRVPGDADLGHPLGVVLAVPGDRLERDDGQTRPRTPRSR